MMTHLSPPIIDLHDSVLDALAVEWSTGVCVMHLRAAGPDGGRPVRIRWHGLRELGVTGGAPWGPSSSVLEAQWGGDGVDEIRMQSGDVIRVRAQGRTIEADGEPIASRYGGLAADALVDSGVIAPPHVERATSVIAEEIRVRRSLGDV